MSTHSIQGKVVLIAGGAKNLGGLLARDLAAHVGITEANLSLLKSGKVKGVRFETLAAICEYLQCQPGDLLEWVPGAEDGAAP